MKTLKIINLKKIKNIFKTKKETYSILSIDIAPCTVDLESV
jgi:hypothetical protein